MALQMQRCLTSCQELSDIMLLFNRYSKSTGQKEQEKDGKCFKERTNLETKVIKSEQKTICCCKCWFKTW